MHAIDSIDALIHLDKKRREMAESGIEMGWAVKSKGDCWEKRNKENEFGPVVERIVIGPFDKMN